MESIHYDRPSLYSTSQASCFTLNKVPDKWNFPEINSFNKNLKLCGRICTIREELLTEEQTELQERVTHYLTYGDKGRLDPYDKKAIMLFEGEIDLDELKNFADLRKLLEIIKIIDFVLAEYNRKIKNKYNFSTSSYDIRTKILEIDPNFTTNEIYTKTLDPRKFKNRNYLMHSVNWIPERVGYQAKLIINQFVKTLSLSKHLNLFTNNNFIIRGPTGAGKSH